MKKLALIVIALGLGLSTSFAGNGDKDKSEDRDQQVSVTGKQTQDLVYFKLLMINESTDGVYSMVKKFDDGTFVSVAIRNFYANCIDAPLMYSFVDRDLSDEDVTYVLYRISDGSEVVQSWRYCADKKELCEASTSEVFHAMNN
ncbi:MAG: hypothetical protein ACI837_001806 [Crocinitomicaceae bacterium]|jgi:hypothetical protein